MLDTVTGRSAGAVQEGAARPQQLTESKLLAIAVVVVVLPIAVVCGGLIGRAWHPASDDAIEVLRIGDVGGAHTPLTGVWSRFGWDHPGPLLFWVLAPFERVLGMRGVLVGTAVVNAVALAVALVAARRRGGWPLVGIVAVVGAALTVALGTDLLIEPWSPWIAVLPFLAYLLAAWCVSDGDHRWLPVVAGLGTFLVQTHVGYLPLVIGVAAIAVVLGELVFRRRPVLAGGHRRSVVVAIGALAVLWLAPVGEQLFGGGNLGALLSFIFQPAQPTAGWAKAWGVFGTEIGFPGAWLGGGDASVFEVPTSSVWPALVLTALTAGLAAAAWRRGAASAGRLAALAITATMVGIVATARVTGPMWPYVVRWWWVTAAVMWLSVIWSACALLTHRDIARRMGALGLGAAALIAVLAAWKAVPVVLPVQQMSVASGHLGADTAATPDPTGRYLITSTDSRGWGGVGEGLFVDLHDRGFRLAVPPDWSPPFERWRTQAPSPDWSTLIVVGEDDLSDGWMPPDGAQAIASYDPLTTAERSRARALQDQLMTVAWLHDPSTTVGDAVVRGSMGAYEIDPATVDQLKKIRALGSAYTVFLVPAAA